MTHLIGKTLITPTSGRARAPSSDGVPANAFNLQKAILGSRQILFSGDSPQQLE